MTLALILRRLGYDPNGRHSWRMPKTFDPPTGRFVPAFPGVKWQAFRCLGGHHEVFRDTNDLAGTATFQFFGCCDLCHIDSYMCGCHADGVHIIPSPWGGESECHSIALCDERCGE